MAVTDLSGAPDMSALPWWLQLGTGPNGEMPGGGVMGRKAVTPGANTGGASWLNYLGNMFNPFGAAQAADNPQMAALKDAAAAQASGQPQPQDPRLAAAASLPPPAAPPQPRVPFSAPMQGGGPAYAGAAPGPPPQPPYNPLSGGSANAGLPAAPAAATPAATPVPGPLAAQGQPSRFGTFSYQNPNSTRNAPIYTALNLGGLFGGGANPANVPAANAQPVSGALARPGHRYGVTDISRLPYNQQQSSMPAIQSQISQPNWWERLGSAIRS